MCVCQRLADNYLPGATAGHYATLPVMQAAPAYATLPAT